MACAMSCAPRSGFVLGRIGGTDVVGVVAAVVPYVSLFRIECEHRINYFASSVMPHVGTTDRAEPRAMRHLKRRVARRERGTFASASRLSSRTP